MLARPAAAVQTAQGRRALITDARSVALSRWEVTSESLHRAVEDFLAGAGNAVVLENGVAAFDLAEARYSISGEYNKCLLHLWSADRSVVRRVLSIEAKRDVLRLEVQCLGQTWPTKLEICRERDRRTPTAKKITRSTYQSKLQRMLERQYPGHVVGRLSSSIDLERSFGPIYARGLLRQGQSAVAVMGVNADETQSFIDACLTFGILWLDACRQHHAGKLVVSGLKLFLPPGTSAMVQNRMGHLDHGLARFELYEVDEQQMTLEQVDWNDCGNIATRLVHTTDEAAARARFHEEISYVKSLYARVEVAVLNPAEVAFRCLGLEFARARLFHEPGTASSTPQLVFGLGCGETVFDHTSADRFRALVYSIAEVRHADGPRDHLLWRMHPERWLESLTLQCVNAVDEHLDSDSVYSQVPAFSAADRAMIDVLSVTREGRLAVIELKADEDLHLPLQGVDYWLRVSWHHRQGEFKSFGYFPTRELSPQPPLLYLVAPALHIHPATDTILRYLSPAIPWSLVGIDERWRSGVRPVFRKRPGSSGSSAATADR